MGIFDKLGRLIDDALFLPDEVRTTLDRAEALLDEGDAAGAEVAIETVLKERPDHPRVLTLQARARRGLGDLPAALTLLRRAVSIDPSDPETQYELAVALRESGDDGAAIETLKGLAAQLAREGGAAFARVQTALAAAHLRTGRPDRAVRELRKAAVAAPSDPEVHLLLGEALLADREPVAARAAFARAAELEPAPALAARIGAGLLDLGAPADAEAALRLACLDPEVAPRARADLARALLADGDVAGAIEEARLAGEARPRDPEPRRIEADAHSRAGDAAAALAAWESALALDVTDAVSLRGAVRAAANAGDLLRAEALAGRLAERLPGDAVARAALARAALSKGDIARAAELAEGAGRAGGSEAGRDLARVAAEVALAKGDGEAALEALAEVPDAPAELLDRAARSVALAGGPAELPVLVERLHRYALARPALAGLAVEVARVRGELDRPLQLAVMGEFNAGKSTFINALIGEEVAPMGVTPTTATLNVLKYGAEKKVRVVYLDDTVREGAYAELKDLLAEAASRTRSVRRVEILFPAEALLRVNLVDTPGMNALDPEHEKVALRAIDEADAIVWLFRAGQAGKDSERRALDAIRGHRRKMVGILNQIDRVSLAEVPGLVGHLEQELGGSYFEAVAALSARDALKAKRTGDAQLLSASGIEALERLLEERFYANALLLKRRSSAVRLEELLGRLYAEQTRELGALTERVTRLEGLAADRDRVAAALARTVVAATERVDRAMGGLERQAASEVDDFVRPRAGLLARRGFAEEDRRFLGELLDERLEALAREEEGKLRSELGAVVDPFVATLLTADAAPALAAAVELCVARGLTALTAYQRGILAGGALERLFDRELRPQSARPEIERALRSVTADPRVALAPALEAGRTRVVGELVAAHGRALEEATRRERVFRCRTVDPLRGFAAVAKELAAS